MGTERPTVFLFAGESRVPRFILKGQVRMKKSDLSKLLAVTWLICVCTLYTSLSHAGTLVDNFDGASINKRLWEQWNTDQNQRCLQENGVLKIQIGGASTGSIFGAGVYSNFQLKGDFEIVVDYSFIKWPDSNGVRTGLRYNGQPTAHGMIMRISPDKNATINPQGYYSTNFIDGSYNNVSMSPTTATSGRFKLTRVGSVMTGYYFQDNNWVYRGSYDYSVTDALPEWIGIDFSAWSHTALQQPDGKYVYPFAGKDVEVTIDNLQITYDKIEYFSSPVPIPGILLLLLD